LACRKTLLLLEERLRMKLYDSEWAPNPRRVHIFMAEKGIEIERSPVDLKTGAHLQPDFAGINPLHRVPVLELDDGDKIAESVAICRYLEETYPEPPLFGRTAKEKAFVEMWNRRVELGFSAAVSAAFRHCHPKMAVAEKPQVKDWGEANRAKALDAMMFLDRALSKSQWLAGAAFTIADITLLVAFDFMKVARLTCPDECRALLDWHARASARPSAGAR
jgi:glutathione S-transferase